MRVKPKANVQLFEDATTNNPLLALSDSEALRSLDGYTEASIGTLNVGQPAGAITVPKGTITVPAGLFLRSTEDFNAVIDGATIAVRKPLKAFGTRDAYAVLYLDAAFTTLTVACAPGADPATVARVIFAIWGDEVLA